MKKRKMKIVYRFWGWTSFCVLVTSIVMLFVLEKIPTSLIITAIVSFISLFVWSIRWGEKDWDDSLYKPSLKTYTSKTSDYHNTNIPPKKEEKELSAIENLAGLYMIDKIFGGDLFGKK